MRTRLALLVAVFLAWSGIAFAQTTVTPASCVNGAGDACGSVRFPAGSYINFGATKGTSGYGLRDNSGTIQFKNSGDVWTDISVAAGATYWTRTGSELFTGTSGDTLVLGSAGTRSPIMPMGAGVIALRDGVVAQEFRVYTTYAGAATDYEYASLKGAAGSITLSAATLGTGTDNVDVVLLPAGAGGVKVGATATQDTLVFQPNTSGTRFVGTFTPDDLTAARTYTLPNASGTVLIAMYAGMYQYGNGTALAIGTNAEYYALSLMSTGLLQGWTYIAGVGGGPGATITGVASADGGAKITVSATGTWVAGQPATIHGTTDYDGAYLITTGGTGSFVLTKAYTQNRTGIARGAVALKASAGSAGTYEIGFTSSASSAASKTFHVELWKNTTAQDHVAGKAQTSVNSTYRTLAGVGHVAIADGDVIWIACYNDTDASNLTFEFINVVVKRIGS